MYLYIFAYDNLFDNDCIYTYIYTYTYIYMNSSRNKKINMYIFIFHRCSVALAAFVEESVRVEGEKARNSHATF